MTLELGVSSGPARNRDGSSLATFADTVISGSIRVRRFAGPATHADQLDHLRVAHLTDLHIGRITPLKVQLAAVELTNALHPDLVAITGDFVCHSQAHLDSLRQIIRCFHAPVVCVLGNHDHWSGAQEVRRALHQAGAEVLDNARTLLTLRGQKLQVVGLDDAYTGHADRRRALRGVKHDIAALGLSHIAEEADGLWAGGVPLVLSGHTHAGQITLARLNELALGRLGGHRYVHGLYGARHPAGAGAVYVSAGIGASVMPLRIGARARREVAVFELGTAPGAIAEPHSEQLPLNGRAPSPRRQYLRAAAVVRKERRRAQLAGCDTAGRAS